MKPNPLTGKHLAVLTAAVVAAVSVSVYLGALRGGYVWDDRVLMDGSAIGGGSVAGCFTSAFLSHYYRPLVSLSFVLDRTLWPNHPLASHWINIGAHGASSMVVLGLVYTAFRRLSVALAASLLYAVHPAHVGAVAWIGGRTDALGALWTSLFAWGLIAAVRSHGDRRSFLLSLSVAAYALAVYTKEQTLALLPLVPLAFAWFKDNAAPGHAQSPMTIPGAPGHRVELPGTGWYALGPYVVVTAMFLAMGVYLGMPKPPGLWVPLTEHLTRAAETVAGYTALLAMPNQTLMHLFSIDAIIARRPWPMLAGLGAVMGIVVASARLWRKDRATLWFVVFVVLALVPVSGLVPLPFILFAPYRASVAVIGFAVVLARSILTLRRRAWGMERLPAVAALCAAAAWCTAHTIQGITTWETEHMLFTRMVEYDPGAIVGHYMLARAAVAEGRDEDAGRHIEHILDKLYGEGRTGGCNWRNPDQAVEGLRSDWRVRSRVMQNRGGVGDAEDYLTTLFVQLGYSRLHAGGPPDQKIRTDQEAEAAFETALRWRPKDPDANLGMGWIRLEAARYADAERHLRTTLTFAPDRSDALRLLAQTLERQGSHAEARRCWQMWQNDLAGQTGGSENPAATRER